METIFTVQQKESGLYLQDVLANQLNISKKKAKLLLDNRCVFVNKRRIWMAKHRLHSGDILEVVNTSIGNQKIGILYEDEACLVANKPSGMLSNGKNSCETQLQKETDNKELSAVHRLDKDTSGCLLFAKNKKVEKELINQFKEHNIKKQYLALILGKPRKTTGIIRKNIDEQTAETEYQLIQGSHIASLVKIRILTGRTHQIRKHFMLIEHPVLGDKKYGKAKIQELPLRRIPRQMLHASKITFFSPISQKNVSITAPEPKDFKEFRNLVFKGSSPIKRHKRKPQDTKQPRKKRPSSR